MKHLIVVFILLIYGCAHSHPEYNVNYRLYNVEQMAKVTQKAEMNNQCYISYVMCTEQSSKRWCKGNLVTCLRYADRGNILCVDLLASPTIPDGDFIPICGSCPTSDNNCGLGE